MNLCGEEVTELCKLYVAASLVAVCASKGVRVNNGHPIDDMGMRKAKYSPLITHEKHEQPQRCLRAATYIPIVLCNCRAVHCSLVISSSFCSKKQFIISFCSWCYPLFGDKAPLVQWFRREMGMLLHILD